DAVGAELAGIDEGGLVEGADAVLLGLPVTTLAVLDECGAPALHGRSALWITAAAGLAQSVEAGLVRGADVQHASGRVGGAAAPVRATKLAGDRDLVAAQRLRREDAFVARRGDDAAQALALGGIDVGVELVDGEAQAGEWRRLGRERLRGPRLFARNI